MNKNIYLLHQLLIDSVNKYPDRLAIKANGLSITYKDLDEKSTKLANILLRAGFKEKDLVAIVLKKSIESVISMLAVLKVGGAYIPLDPNYSPIARIHNIVDFSEVDYIITTESQWDELRNIDYNKADSILKQMNIFLIDDILESKNNKPNRKYKNDHSVSFYYFNSNESKELEMTSTTISEDLAYILFTSGSTGVPKGVMISHINALTFINWSLNCFIPEENDVFTNFAPLHFDLSVFDIYVSIASGACVSMVPYNIASNPRAIIEWAKQEKVTIWYSVPSVWVSILSYGNLDENSISTLKYVLFAGEVFPPRYLKKLMTLIPKAMYYNLYGPTETNVCTYHLVKNAEAVKDKPVPIGIPCENTDIIVVNDNNETVEDNEEGELLARGSIVTKGYFKDTEKTNSVFKNISLRKNCSNDYYRTSDIVKRVNGVYEYIGRKDLMVKCAGFRVELQEVEYALFQIENVEEAVVVPYNDTITNITKLYAILKIKSDANRSVIIIKQKLSLLLPKYMIPEIIEFTDDIIKNSNGKVDRTLLKSLVYKKMETQIEKDYK